MGEGCPKIEGRNREGQGFDSGESKNMPPHDINRCFDGLTRRTELGEYQIHLNRSDIVSLGNRSSWCETDHGC